jgi:predicted nucleotidyltransferase
MEPDRSGLEQLVQRIVEEAHPLRIILFGSAARGEMTPDSDVDMLVVMPEGTHRRHTAERLHQRMFGVALAADIMVATPSDLGRHRDNVGLIYHQILKEGKGDLCRLRPARPQS